MRILVTGAGGYIGRHLVPRLKDEGHEVWGTYRADNRPTHDAPVYSYADLSEIGALERKRHVHPVPDTVIHLAGRVEINLLPNPEGAHLPPVPGPCDIGALYRDNVLATANVLQYCLQAGVKHLIFASTQAVYGMFYQEDYGRDLAIDPLEHYAASKVAAERIAEMGRKQGLVVSILRLPGVYGGDRKDGIVYQMCRDALAKGLIRLTTPYPLPINALHIDDVVGAFVAALTAPGATLDVSGVEACSLTRLAQDIAELVPGTRIECRGVLQPLMAINPMPTEAALHWHPKPRKERLAQVLEEIRCDAGNT